MDGPRLEHLVHIPMTQDLLRLAQRQSKLACIGGRSNIREDDDRQDNLSIDQTVGQIGQIALALWKDGHVGEYLSQRAAANAYPTQGDGGSDLLGSNIDVKASRLKRDADPLRYRLAVRPAELHEGWMYVLCLVEPMLTSATLVGWATAEEISEWGPETDGPFAGAYTLQATDLHRMPPIDWTRRSGL